MRRSGSDSVRRIAGVTASPSACGAWSGSCGVPSRRRWCASYPIQGWPCRSCERRGIGTAPGRGALVIERRPRRARCRLGRRRRWQSRPRANTVWFCRRRSQCTSAWNRRLPAPFVAAEAPGGARKSVKKWHSALAIWSRHRDHPTTARFRLLNVPNLPLYQVAHWSPWPLAARSCEMVMRKRPSDFIYQLSKFFAKLLASRSTDPNLSPSRAVSECRSNRQRRGTRDTILMRSR